MIRLECMSRDGTYRPVDIFKDESILMQFESIPVTQIGNRQMPYSESFVIPLTQSNADLFGISVGSITISNKTNKCVLYNEDNVLFTGTFEVAEVTTRSKRNYIALNLYDRIRSAIDNLNEMTFAEYLDASTKIDARTLMNPAVPIKFEDTDGLCGNIFARLTGDLNGNKMYGTTVSGDSMTMPLCFNTLELIKDMFEISGVSVGGGFVDGLTKSGFDTSDLGVILDVDKIQKTGESLESRELLSYPCLGNGNVIDLDFPNQQFVYNPEYSHIDNVAWDWSVHGLNANDIYKPILPVSDTDTFLTDYKRGKKTNYKKGDGTIDINVMQKCFRTNVKLIIDPKDKIYPNFDSITWFKMDHITKTQIRRVTGDDLNIRINYGVNGNASFSRIIATIDVTSLSGTVPYAPLPSDWNQRDFIFKEACTPVLSDPSDPDHIFEPQAGTYYDIWFSFESKGTTNFECDPEYSNGGGRLYHPILRLRGSSLSGSGTYGAVMSRIMSSDTITHNPTVYEKILSENVIATGDYDGINYSSSGNSFVGYSLFDSFDDVGLKCSDVLNDILKRYNLGIASSVDTLIIDPIMELYSDIEFDVESILDSDVSVKYDKDGIDKLSIVNKKTSDIGSAVGYKNVLGNIEEFLIDVDSKKDLTISISSTIVNSRMHGSMNSMDDGMIKKINSFPDSFYFGFEAYKALSYGSFSTRHCFIGESVYVDVYTPILNACSAFENLSDPQWRGYSDSRYIKNPTSTRIAPKRITSYGGSAVFTKEDSSTISIEIESTSISVIGTIDPNRSYVTVGSVSSVPFSKSYLIPVFDNVGRFCGEVTISTTGDVTFEKSSAYWMVSDENNSINSSMSSVGYYDADKDLIKYGDNASVNSGSNEIVTLDKDFIYTDSIGFQMPTVQNSRDGITLFYGDGSKPVENSVYSYFFKKYIESVSITNGVSVTADIYISTELASQLQSRPKALLYADNGGNPVTWYVSKVENVDLSLRNGGVYSITLTKDL